MQSPIFQLTGVDQVIPVKGFEGAKAYPLGANSRVPLFDEDEDVFYIKATDENGFPSLRTFDYKERIAEEEKTITLNDIRAIIKEELANAKEELRNGQQSIPETRVSTNANGSTINDAEHAITKHSSSAASYTKPKPQSRQNTSALANGKEQS